MCCYFYSNHTFKLNYSLIKSNIHIIVFKLKNEYYFMQTKNVAEKSKKYSLSKHHNVKIILL